MKYKIVPTWFKEYVILFKKPFRGWKQHPQTFDTKEEGEDFINHLEKSK